MVRGGMEVVWVVAMVSLSTVSALSSSVARTTHIPISFFPPPRPSLSPQHGQRPFLHQLLPTDTNHSPPSLGNQDDDYSGAHSHASQYHDGPSDDASLFQNATSNLGQYKQQIGNDPNIDEDEMINRHQSFYGGGGPPAAQHAGAGAMGSAAAMQALKKFTGGGQGGGMMGGQQGGMGGGYGQQQGGGGMGGMMGGGAGGGGMMAGGGQNALIGMAMSEAAKLFDKQSASGNVVSPICASPPLPPLYNDTRRLVLL